MCVGLGGAAEGQHATRAAHADEHGMHECLTGEGLPVCCIRGGDAVRSFGTEKLTDAFFDHGRLNIPCGKGIVVRLPAMAGVGSRA